MNPKHRKSRARLSLLWGFLLCVTPAIAQQGAFKGKAKDSALLPLADVRISLVDSNSDTIATTLSMADGRYEFDQVPAGTYIVVADLPEFAPFTLAGIQVHVNKITFADVKLTHRGVKPEKGNVCNWRRKG